MANVEAIIRIRIGKRAGTMKKDDTFDKFNNLFSNLEYIDDAKDGGKEE